MDINQIGLLIAYKRTRDKVSVKELCEGICSRSFISRVEAGQRGVEKIVAEALLQRLGVSSDRMLYFLNMKECQWLKVKEEMISAINENDVKKAKRFMGKYRKLTKKKSRLHRQFLCLSECVLEWKGKGCRQDDRAVVLAEIEDKLVEAWKITRENYAIEGECPKYLGFTEFYIKSLYFYLQEEQGREEQALQGYRNLLCYIEEKMDVRDQVNCYPQVAYRMLTLMERIENCEEEEKERIFQNCIALLKKQGGMVLLKELAEYRKGYLQKEAAKNRNAAPEKELEELEDVISVTDWLYRTYQVNTTDWFWRLPFGREEVFPLVDIFKYRRQALGLTQEKLVEGICDPVTISRIENGASNCSRSHIGELMDRLRLPSGMVVYSVQTGRADLHEVVTEISRLSQFSRYKESENLFNEMKDKVVHNRYVDQYLQRQEAAVNYNMKRLSVKEHWEMQMQALHLTVPEKEPEELEDWIFTRTEAMIVNMLSYGCDKIGESKTAIRWLSIVRNYYERQIFSMHHYFSGYELTLRNLGNLLGNEGKYEEAIKCEDLSIRVALEVGDTRVLRVVLYDRGWNMEKLWEKQSYTKEESRLYVKAALVFNRLYSKPESITRVERRWKEYYANGENGLE